MTSSNATEYFEWGARNASRTHTFRFLSNVASLRHSFRLNCERFDFTVNDICDDDIRCANISSPPSNFTRTDENAVEIVETGGKKNSALPISCVYHNNEKRAKNGCNLSLRELLPSIRMGCVCVCLCVGRLHKPQLKFVLCGFFVWRVILFRLGSFLFRRWSNEHLLTSLYGWASEAWLHRFTETISMHGRKDATLRGKQRMEDEGGNICYSSIIIIIIILSLSLHSIRIEDAIVVDTQYERMYEEHVTTRWSKFMIILPSVRQTNYEMAHRAHPFIFRSPVRWRHRSKMKT